MEKRHQNSIRKKYTATDLFAGIGGIRKGFELAFGKECIEFIFASEIFEPARKVYLQNFGENEGILNGDIRDFTNDERKLKNDIPFFDILTAGFPCQSFSMVGLRQGFDDQNGRGNLFFEIEHILREKKPNAFFLENVKHLIHHDVGRTFIKIRDILERKLDYFIHYGVLDAQDFGLAQKRPRIYIVGFKENYKFHFPENTERYEEKVLKNVIEPESVSDDLFLSQQYWEGLVIHKWRHHNRSGFGYIVRDLNETSGALMKSANGREWNLIKSSQLPKKHYEKSNDDKKLPNIDGIRELSVSEMRKLQGFPEDFIIKGISQNQARQILGNSVPVPVVQKIARKMKDSLDNPEILTWKLNINEKLSLNLLSMINERSKNQNGTKITYTEMYNFFEVIDMDRTKELEFLRYLIENNIIKDINRDGLIISQKIPLNTNFEAFRRDVIKWLKSRYEIGSIARYGENYSIKTNRLENIFLKIKREYEKQILCKKRKKLTQLKLVLKNQTKSRMNKSSRSQKEIQHYF